MEKISFADRVYEKCSLVPEGKVTTYGEIAKALGGKGFQAVGNALRCNPYAPKVPCHRVVRGDGSIGGFKGSVVGVEVQEKIALLRREGVLVKDGKVDLRKFLFEL